LSVQGVIVGILTVILLATIPASASNVAFHPGVVLHHSGGIVTLSTTVECTHVYYTGGKWMFQNAETDAGAFQWWISVTKDVEVSKFFRNHTLTITISGPAGTYSWVNMSIPYVTHATARINNNPTTECGSLTELGASEQGWFIDRNNMVLYVKVRHYSASTIEVIWAESELPTGGRGGGGGTGGEVSTVSPSVPTEELRKPEVLGPLVLTVSIIILIAGVKSRPKEWVLTKKKRKWNTAGTTVNRRRRTGAASRRRCAQS